MRGIDEETFPHGFRCNYFIDNRHLAHCGVHSFSSCEAMESLAFSPNPGNWLGSVRTIVNYFTWKALQLCGFHEEVVAVADKRISSLISDLNRTFLSMRPTTDTGIAIRHTGFIVWDLLILEMIRSEIEGFAGPLIFQIASNFPVTHPQTVRQEFFGTEQSSRSKYA